MKKIEITEIIKTIAPDFKGVAISCRVRNSEPDEALWKELDAEMLHFCECYKVEQINKRKPIQATRQAYKALGKDPNRYRPSAEALCRRILKEKSLYRINTLVDLINLVSIHTGFSIGGFDAARISGDTLWLGAGKADEVFCGIGRGPLNIEGLPVYRDAVGGIGTPTSDEERTKLTVESTDLLMIINGYSGEEGLDEAVAYSIELLKRYAEATEIEVVRF
ncbi:MAG: phenylalanine--tRNA ligase beta subunit-related protein [Bacteroidales bacterium]